jgi:transposase
MEQYPTEVYAELFAFMSLISSNETERADPAERARTRSYALEASNDLLGSCLSLRGVVCAVGPAHRKLERVHSLGIDEIHWGKGKRADNFLTVIYQIDSHSRRLLWVGRRRTQATLRRGLAALGSEVVGGLRFVCSDMWQAYLKVIALRASQALHLLDRFHITLHLNKALDQVRRAESGRLRGRPMAQRLKRMRWHLLRRGSRVRGRARRKLNDLLASKLATARAWNLKETFQYIWHYKSHIWAEAFLDYWCSLALAAGSNR